MEERKPNMKNYIFTSESVTEGHPDKICDTISDSILDAYLEQDKESRVAVETFVSKNQVVIAGQITTKAQIDIEKIARETIKEIGYDNEATDMDYRTCKIEVNVTKQSPDIALGVDVGGAGDQGIMFGYACDETEEYMPYAIAMAHKLSYELTKARKTGEIPYLRPDGKTQVTVEYENDRPKRIEAILISIQHKPEVAIEMKPQAMNLPVLVVDIIYVHRRSFFALLQPLQSLRGKSLPESPQPIRLRGPTGFQQHFRPHACRRPLRPLLGSPQFLFTITRIRVEQIGRVLLHPFPIGMLVLKISPQINLL